MIIEEFSTIDNGSKKIKSTPIPSFSAIGGSAFG